MDVHTVTGSQSRREATQAGDPARESGEPVAAPSQNPTLSSSVTEMSSIYFDPACQTYYATHNRNFSWNWAANNFFFFFKYSGPLFFFFFPINNEEFIWILHNANKHNLFSIKFLFIYLFIYLWLCWVFVSVRGLSLVAASRGHSSTRCAGLSQSRPLLLWSTGSRRAGSVIVAHGPSCSVACGIFPDQGSNPCPLHWQAGSQPLRHQGSPANNFYVCK